MLRPYESVRLTRSNARTAVRPYNNARLSRSNARTAVQF
jgi:hypothetical protein